mmetsp:Transcript_48075/g.79657  ORF Transcript_48075/g.79657 Transcript_48075/m.79657 type:complete len:210 (-) Transcript_48075:578-1207(-)
MASRPSRTGGGGPHQRATNISSSSSSSSSTWADVKRRARALESKIDSKLVQYLNMANKWDSDNKGVSGDVENARRPLQDLEIKIQDMLQELGGVTDEMRQLASGKSSNHREGFETMRRCQNLFHQFTSDFERTKVKLDSKIKRAMLLGSKHDGKDSSLAGIRPHEALEKERDGLFSSLGIVDSLIQYYFCADYNMYVAAVNKCKQRFQS